MEHLKRISDNKSMKTKKKAFEIIQYFNLIILLVEFRLYASTQCCSKNRGIVEFGAWALRVFISVAGRDDVDTTYDPAPRFRHGSGVFKAKNKEQ